MGFLSSGMVSDDLQRPRDTENRHGSVLMRVDGVSEREKSGRIQQHLLDIFFVIGHKIIS